MPEQIIATEPDSAFGVAAAQRFEHLNDDTGLFSNESQHHQCNGLGLIAFTPLSRLPLFARASRLLLIC